MRFCSYKSEIPGLARRLSTCSHRFFRLNPGPKYTQAFSFLRSTISLSISHTHTRRIGARSLSAHPAPATKLFTHKQLITFLLLTLLIAFMPLGDIFSKLARPFSQSVRMSNPASSAPGPIPDGAKRCTVAAGCFWGTEHLYRRHFANKGLLDAKVGYIGGDLENPSYRAVCGGKTGHAEAAQIIYDPEKVSYKDLLEFFYKMHDPTTLNAQGPDTGPQYRSAIYWHDEEQEKIAKDVTKKANEQWWKGGIVTELAPAGKWWTAEQYHQAYLDNNPAGYECPSHFLRPFPPLE